MPSPNPAIAMLVAAGISQIVTPIVRYVAHRTGALDHPVHRKGLVQRIVPRLGGLAIAAGLWAAWGMAIALSGPEAFSTRASTHVAFLIGGGLILLLGVFDDYKGLGARTKFFVQFLVAATILYQTPDLLFDRIAIPYFVDIPLGWFAMPITLAWVVGITNAINLIDGLDGLAGGVSCIAALCLGLIAAEYGQPGLQVVCLALAGGCLGFLPFNFRSASIFLGDSGSLFLGFNLAVLSLAVDSTRPAGLSFVIPLVVLGYPILDTLLVMARRGAVGKPLFSGDQRHIHHQIVAHGFSRTTAVLVLYVLSGVFGFIAVVWSIDNRRLSWVGLGVLAAIMLVGVKVLKYDHLVSPARLSKLAHERLHYKKFHKTARHTVTILRRASHVDHMLEAFSNAMADYDLLRVEFSVCRDGVGLDALEPLTCGVTYEPPVNGNHYHEEVRLLNGFLVARLTVVNDHLSPKLLMERNIHLNHILDVMAQRLRELERGTKARVG